jgi:urocanate hydratase
MASSSSPSLDFPNIAFVYARFAALAAMSADLGGWLVFSRGLHDDGIALTMAANVAGAASLIVEPDVARAKQALRWGVCDFVVNTLDEALRILKNEIRRRRAVSVVLTRDGDAATAEMVARGVQPEILGFPVPELMERGARLFAQNDRDGRIALTWSISDEPLPPGKANATCAVGTGVRWLAALDALAVASLANDDARIRWVEAAPRYLGRAFAGQRFLRMSEVEADVFLAGVRDGVAAGSIPAAVSIARDGDVISLAS